MRPGAETFLMLGEFDRSIRAARPSLIRSSHRSDISSSIWLYRALGDAVQSCLSYSARRIFLYTDYANSAPGLGRWWGLADDANS